jgi:hypothetical protein
MREHADSLPKSCGCYPASRKVSADLGLAAQYADLILQEPRNSRNTLQLLQSLREISTPGIVGLRLQELL